VATALRLADQESILSGGLLLSIGLTVYRIAVGQFHKLIEGELE
jgi:hypothetical protein